MAFELEWRLKMDEQSFLDVDQKAEKYFQLKLSTSCKSAAEGWGK